MILVIGASTTMICGNRRIVIPVTRIIVAMIRMKTMELLQENRPPKLVSVPFRMFIQTCLITTPWLLNFSI
jgi:hypothetical protein